MRSKIKSNGRVRSAFTLVEFLLCLAVIALIAIIVVPVLANARWGAHRSSCSNNMHQCGLAINMYLEDYDNYYPTYRVDPLNANHADDLLYWHDHFCRASLPSPGQVTWVMLTRPYLSGSHRRSSPLTYTDSSDVHHCPDDTNRAESATSYEYKMLLATGLPMSEVHVPGATALLWEQWGFHSGERSSEYDRRTELNVVFADQHVAWLSLSSTINARYGKGPDLHWLPSGPTITSQFTSQDVGF